MPKVWNNNEFLETSMSCYYDNILEYERLWIHLTDIRNHSMSFQPDQKIVMIKASAEGRWVGKHIQNLRMDQSSAQKPI